VYWISGIDDIVHWPFVPVLTRMGLAVAIGLFVGLEREHSGKAGVRTFALVAVLGCLGGLLGNSYAVGSLGLVALLAGLAVAGLCGILVNGFILEPLSHLLAKAG
jgi:uncharacterized membrane protein YhiD involved in acid resistance